MKKASLFACAGLLAVAGVASAQNQGRQQSHQDQGQQYQGQQYGQHQGGFAPTPGMITMMSLGQAGLLGSMFSNEIYGNTQAKTGASRATIGYIEDSLVGQGVPEAFWPDFKDRGTTVVVPMALVKELPSSSGASFIRVKFEPNWARGKSGLPVQSKGGARRAELQFLHAPIPTRIFGVGLIYEKSGYDIYFNEDPVGTAARSDRKAWGLQLHYAEAYSQNWALASRAEYQKGKSDYSVSNSFFRQHNHFDEDRLYMQAELIGSYTKQQIGFLPETWLFRPIIGANYQKSRLGDASVSVVGKKHENYGAVWARARFEKRQAPGPQWQFMPTFSVGIEREYVNDLDKWLKEPTYALASAGFGLARAAFRMDVEYNLRKGLKGNRTENVISASMTYQF